MKRLLPLVLAACGGETPSAPLSLSAEYTLVGVGRVFPEETVPDALAPMFLSVRELTLSGDRVTGRLFRTGDREGAAFSGRWDPLASTVVIEPFAGALTTTTAEQIEGFGGRFEDALPKDGVADGSTGYVRGRAGRRIFDGRFIGVSKGPVRPERPDAARLSAALISVGRARAKGILTPRAGVELYRMTLGKSELEFTLGVAGEDGAFDVEVAALEGDVIIVRATVGGVASDARTVIVTRQ